MNEFWSVLKVFFVCGRLGFSTILRNRELMRMVCFLKSLNKMKINTNFLFRKWLFTIFGIVVSILLSDVERPESVV